jgi:hypothetical protein
MKESDESTPERSLAQRLFSADASLAAALRIDARKAATFDRPY